jgi:RimJ/RimL family protein N-acetyltransferase
MFPRSITLHDGTYLLRPLQATDAERLQAFFYSHTPESIHLRYGYMITQMSGERAHELTGVDQNRDCALALFEESNDDPVIHAVARYCLDEDARSAEIAFIVRETKQRLGMAELMVRELISVARERGLSSVWCQVLRENVGALALLKKLRFQKTGVDEGSFILRLDLKGKASKTVKPAKSKAR